VRYSVIIPYFRTPEITRLCLYSVFKFAQGDPEVIVVDNAPGSVESAMLREFEKAIVLDNATTKRGSDANFDALERGLARATHDLVALIHSDSIFLRHGWDVEWFSYLQKHDLAGLSTFDRESNPFRPLRKRIADRLRHLRHVRRVRPDAREKLMVYFLLTRRSVLARAEFSFIRDRDITVAHLARAGRPIEVLSALETSRFLWHTSNVTSLLTGQMNDPKLAAIYREKRTRLLAEPSIREAFGPVLPRE